MIKKFLKKIPFVGPILTQVNGYYHSAKFRDQFNKTTPGLSDNGRFIARWEDRIHIGGEATATTGFDAHYLYHTAWAARILSKSKPKLHIDIASDVRFVTIVSAYIPVDFYDYRPVDFSLSGLHSKHGDITALPFADNSINSISSMHVVEHIGLERYGDSFDPQGDLKAMRELERVVEPGGQILFVVPVGKEARIQYNAHRVYTYDMVCSIFKHLEMETFALVTDKDEYVESASKALADMQSYGCGCWVFKKPKE
jgi:SAM-dependent methyltransferase